MKKPIRKIMVMGMVMLICMTSLIQVSAAENPDAKRTSDISDGMEAETGSFPQIDSGSSSEDISDFESSAGDQTEDPKENTDPERSIDMENDAEIRAKTYAASDWPLVTGTHDKYMVGMNGYFRPEQYMTRAQFAQVIYNLLKTKPTDTSELFSDITGTKWYTKVVNALGNAGIMIGDKGRFYPDSLITRAQAVTAFSRFFDMTTGSVNFQDVKESHWGYKELVSAYIKGWLKGDTNGNIRPNGYLKRVELVIMANRILGRTAWILRRTGVIRICIFLTLPEGTGDFSISSKRRNRM